MARVTLSIAAFSLLNGTCPVCGGDVDIVVFTTHNVVIDCSRCTWADLACKVHGLEPDEIPLCSGTFSSNHPY